MWHELISHHKKSFQQLFGQISIRHTKRLVKSELALPAQKRYVISMPFTAVEEQHYQSLFREMAEECGLDTSGAPMHDDWSENEKAESMRRWLDRLRKATLHPELGIHNRRAFGNRAGPLRSIEEVLHAMIEQNQATLRLHQRSTLQSKLLRGQLFENSPQVGQALAIWEDVRQEITAVVTECREQLRAADTEGTGLDGTSKRPIADEDEEDVEELVTTTCHHALKPC